MPKFGAGSEYGKEQREEARRKKYGIISKKYKPEDQPWIIQHGKTGKSAEKKKYRGVREGGVTENASYYIFTQAADGAFEAFPVQEWYKFQTVQRYKALSYEEAEEEFISRNKTFNLFNVMVRKRMKNTGEDDGGEDDEDGEGKGKGKGKGKKKGGKSELHISEMDEWMESSSDNGSSNDEDNDDAEEKKSKTKKKGKKAAKPKNRKRKNASDEEPVEDSDDGDDEGREVDYISSSGGESDVEPEVKNELKGVAEEDALRKLLNSDEDDEDEEKEEDKDKEEDNLDGEEKDEEAKTSKDGKEEKKKKKEKKKNNKDKKPRKEDYGSSSESDGESSASEPEKPTKPIQKLKTASAESSRSATPTKAFVPSVEPAADVKKKVVDSTAMPVKKPRLDVAAPAPLPGASSSSSSSNDGVNEEAVRRYLSRKPMTTTELLQKFKSKKSPMSSEQLVPYIAQILKRINPVKQMIKGKMYLSLKPWGLSGYAITTSKPLDL